MTEQDGFVFDEGDGQLPDESASAPRTNELSEAAFAIRKAQMLDKNGYYPMTYVRLSETSKQKKAEDTKHGKAGIFLYGFALLDDKTLQLVMIPNSKKRIEEGGPELTEKTFANYFNLSGVQLYGPAKDTPEVDRIKAAMVSAYTKGLTGDAKKAKKAEMVFKGKSIEACIEEYMVGKPFIARLVADYRKTPSEDGQKEYDNYTMKVESFIDWDEYQKLVKAGKHRYPLPGDAADYLAGKRTAEPQDYNLKAAAEKREMKKGQMGPNGTNGANGHSPTKSEGPDEAALTPEHEETMNKMFE